MMNLHVQIYLILYSLIYGFLFSFIVTYHYQYVCKQKRFIRYILSFLFILISVFIYFLCLRKINYGVLHIYSFFLIILGCIIERKVMEYLDKRRR